MTEPMPASSDAERELDEKRLPFTEHLRELRTRTIRASAYLIVAILTAWAFHEQLFVWIKAPYDAGALAAGVSEDGLLAFRGVTEPVIVYLKVSAIVGGLAAMPFVLLEGWLFVAPGLYKRERRLALPFLFASMVCFLSGVAFCRYVVLEPAITVLLGMGGTGTEAAIMMAEYLSFTGTMLFIFGLMFELPVATSFAAVLGLVTHHGLIRNWKYAVVGAFIVGAVATPPDPLTQIALAVPLCVLYGLSIALAYLITKTRGQGEQPSS
jgi:sec-independent protein translocase protein TatC